MDCLFCKIVEGQIPSQKMYEDDRIYVFEDINPIAPVHILIIPKRHISTIDEVQESDKDLLGHMIFTAKNLIKERGIAGGYRLVMNNGVSAGQSVFHLHLHILAGRQFGWPPG